MKPSDLEPQYATVTVDRWSLRAWLRGLVIRIVKRRMWL